jgi:hypothetical protein
MAQPFTYNFRVYALDEQLCSVAVAHIVKAYAPQASLFCESREICRECVGLP